MNQWYVELFRNFADQYEKEEFTKGTSGEVDFIEAEIGYLKTNRILDIGCGTGRHAIELARRGYKVTGIDLSASMLSRASTKARDAGVEVDFIQCDARKLPFSAEFDAAIMLCEGAFPLMETDEMNYMILQSAARALRSGGKFIFSTLNGLFPLYHSVKDFVNSDSKSGSATANKFDLMTFRDIGTFEFTDDNGKTARLHTSERYYVPSEITWQLKSLKFSKIDIYGCKLGAYSRKDTLTTDDFEMLVVAVK